MACKYDENVFQTFKALSVQSVSELKVGETYYTNYYPEKFKVVGFMNDDNWTAQLFEKDGFSYTLEPEADTVAIYALITEVGIRLESMSLEDRNIGNSYNPWLVFKNESDAQNCRNQMPVQIVNDFEDYEYDDE